MLFGAGCIFGCSLIQSRAHPQVPLIQWILGFPAIPIGFVIGRIMVIPKSKDRFKLFIFVILSTLLSYIVYTVFIGLYYGTWFDYGSIYVIRYCIAIPMVCAALHWRGNLDPISKKLGSLSYGIYLVHPLVLIFLYQFGIAIQYPLVLLFLVLAASTLITLLLKRTPFRQFV